MTSAVAGKIKRSQWAQFLDTTPTTGSPTWSLVGSGATSVKVNMNPEVTTEQYVSEDTATKSIDSYSPSMPVEMTAYAGDTVFEYIDNLRRTRATLADAETSLVNVDKYEASGGTGSALYYPAQKENVSIQIDDFGEAGGKPIKINYTINYRGNPTAGSYFPAHPSAGSFIAS